MKIIDRHAWRDAFVRLGLSIAMGLALAGAHSAPASAATAAASAAITYTVYSTTDSSNGTCPGPTCTLRAAITASNGDADDSLILFDSSLGGSTITLGSALPAISTLLTIQGPAGGISISGDNLYQVFNIDPTGALTLQGLTITRGNGTNGGGLYNNGKLTVTSVTFSNNTATQDGGAIYNNTDYFLTVTGSTFSGNSAQANGGAIRVAAGFQNTISGSTFTGNSASMGGGIAMSARLSMSGSVFENNVAGDGGNVGAGGGAYFDNPSTSAYYNLTNVTFSGNQARGRNDLGGGGILVSGGNLVLIHATVVNNSADVVSPSDSSGGGGGISVYTTGGATASLQNSLVANNTSAYNRPDLSGAFTSNGYNLIGIVYGITSDFGESKYDLTGSRSAPLNPLLGPLSYYGGSTKTVPLLPGSPALDRIPNDGTNGCGTSITTDQRGVARAQNGACDIGAVESHGFTLAKTLGDNQGTTAGYGFTQPLGVHVTSAFNEPVVGGQVSFVAPDTGASAILTTVAGTTVSAGLTPNPVITVSIDGSGDASVIPLANDAIGAYQVTASTAGAAPVSFSLSNLEHSTTAVEFTYFDVAPLRGRDVQLSWATSPGANCESFGVYRSESTVLNKAELVQSIPAHAPGDSTNGYSVVDHTPAAGAWWYWLTCVPLGGATTEAVMAGSAVQTFDFTSYLPVVSQP